MVFELLLAEGKIKPQQITALHLMSAFAFLGTGSVFYFFYSPMYGWGIALLLSGFVLVGLSVFRNKWVTKPQHNRILRILELIITLCILSYMAMNKVWVPVGMFGILAVVLLLAFAWEKGSGEQYIYVTEEGIKMPFSSRKRFIEWRDVDNVLYRYGTLTVECGDNRLYQWAIKKARFEREAFESFCMKQAEQSRNKRIKDW